MSSVPGMGFLCSNLNSCSIQLGPDKGVTLCHILESLIMECDAIIFISGSLGQNWEF